VEARSPAPSLQPHPTAPGVVRGALHAIPITFCLTRGSDSHTTASAFVQTAETMAAAPPDPLPIAESFTETVKGYYESA